MLMLKRNPDSYFSRLPRLKKLFWLYFFLLIFEGALRKWVAPQLSAPLLVIRDPIGVWIIWEAFRTRKWPSRWSTAISLLTLLLMGLFAAQLLAGDNLLVELFGLRTYLLPFPVLFVMGENLDREDLRRMGVVTLWLLLPMTLIEVGQYMTSPNSFLNKGAYAGANQISFVSEHARASGTFSFVVGAEEFAVLAATFIAYGMIWKGYARQWLLWVSAFALIVALPTMGSREVLFQLAALLGCVAVGATMGISQFVKILRVVVPLAMIVLLATRLPVFSRATSSLNQRLYFAAQAGQANEGQLEGTINFVASRLFTPIVDTLENPDSQTGWTGLGMGTGAVAVSAVLNGTTRAAAGEGEFDREYREMGPVGGIGFTLFKLLLAVLLVGKALSRARQGEPLALLFLPLAVVFMFFAQLEQPTEQGFVVIGMAFCIAAAKMPERAATGTVVPVQRPRPLPLRARLQRG